MEISALLFVCVFFAELVHKTVSHVSGSFSIYSNLMLLLSTNPDICCMVTLAPYIVQLTALNHHANCDSLLSALLFDQVIHQRAGWNGPQHSHNCCYDLFCVTPTLFYH